jgi:hypothetical protein
MGGKMPLPNCKNCGTQDEFPMLITLCRKEVVLDDRPVCDIYDVAAICIMESAGKPFWSDGDMLLKANVLSLQTTAKVTAKEFIEYVRVKEGPNKGQIPKFRFEASWFRLVQTDNRFASFSPVQKALWSCSIGIGQQSIYYLMHNNEKTAEDPYLLLFMRDPGMQVRHVFAYISSATRHADGEKALAFTRYNSGLSAKHVSGYGARCFAIADHLRKSYATKSQGFSENGV